ncbi:MAG: aminotransferase class V-fold PLP-dependent enzyme [Phycisphaera sp.]|nr:MAG: aminotransferase class V-fold PLP-dependent enzyme [Phycisphaera sp.]
MPTQAPKTSPPSPGLLARHWIHEPGITFLNHGSFGGCPQAVLETQAAWRARLEGEPVRFFAEDLFGLIDWARANVARFIGCDADGLVFVPNATTGAATAIHSLIASGQAEAGDEVLLTDHEYMACANNLRHMAKAAGLGVVTATLPFPNPTPQGVIEAVLGAVTPRTKIALLSHITSASAMVLPAKELVEALEGRGVRVVLDGAHAPGHIDLDVGTLRPSYYTANLHKWVCSPKGSAVLWVHPDQRERCRPLVLSNMANNPQPGRPHLHTEFDYVGTNDPTAILVVPAALRIMAAITRGELPKRFAAEAFDTSGDSETLDASWADIRSRNTSMAFDAQRLLSRELGTTAPVPEDMTACIAMVSLPGVDADTWDRLSERPTKHNDALQDALIANWGIQVPVTLPPTAERQGVPLRCVRLSAQLYNSPEQYSYLAEALKAELAVEVGDGQKRPYTARATL